MREDNRTAITGLDPNAKVSADTSNRKVTVNTTVDRTKIEQALAEVGYSARAA